MRWDGSYGDKTLNQERVVNMKIDIIEIQNYPSGQIIPVYVEQCCAFCDNITDDWTVYQRLGQNFDNAQEHIIGEVDEDSDSY